MIYFVYKTNLYLIKMNKLSPVKRLNNLTSAASELYNKYNKNALLNLLNERGCEIIRTENNPNTSCKDSLRKNQLMNLFQVDNKFSEYCENKWSNKELIDLDEFIHFLLDTPRIFGQNTKGKYQIYMDYIHSYLDVKLTDLYFPNYNELDSVMRYIGDLRDEYLYIYWIDKIVSNHSFLKNYRDLIKPIYQKQYGNNKYYDMTYDKLKVIIEIQEFNNHNDNNNDNDKLEYVTAQGHIILYLKVNEFKESLIDASYSFMNILIETMISKIILYEQSILSDYCVYSFIELLKENCEEITNIISDINNTYFNNELDLDDIGLIEKLSHNKNIDKSLIRQIKRIIELNKIKNNDKYIITQIHKNNTITKKIFEIKKLCHDKKNSKILNVNHLLLLLDDNNINDNDIEKLRDKFFNRVHDIVNDEYCVDWENFVKIIVSDNEYFDDLIKDTLTDYVINVEKIIRDVSIIIANTDNRILQNIKYSIDKYIILREEQVEKKYEKILDTANENNNKLKVDNDVYKKLVSGVLRLNNKLLSRNNQNNVKIVNDYIDNLRSLTDNFLTKKKYDDNDINVKDENMSIFKKLPDFILHYSKKSTDTITYLEFISIMDKYNIHNDTIKSILTKLCRNKKPIIISYIKVIKPIDESFIESDNKKTYFSVKKYLDEIKENELNNTQKLNDVNKLSIKKEFIDKTNKNSKKIICYDSSDDEDLNI